MNYLFTKILGEFELERFIRRLSIGVVLTIVITIWMGVTEGFGHEGVGAAIVTALWLVEGITYGKGIIGESISEKIRVLRYMATRNMTPIRARIRFAFFIVEPF